MFFLLVSVFSGVTLVPTFIYGNEDPDGSLFDMERYTLINALNSPVKMWIVFVVTVVIGVSGHLFVYFHEA
jgi:hypothetical protein